MKLLFLGSGAFGLPTIESLHRDHELLAVITQPDRPAGRKRKLTPTPIGQWAAEQGLALHKPESVNTPEFVAEIKALGADAAIIIAFGQKLSPEFVDALGPLAVNLHASLLPKYRGAAPINASMIHGDDLAGVAVIGIAQRMDAGDVYAEASLPIDPDETAGELHDRLSELGPQTINQVLADLVAGTLNPQPQDESQATKAPKMSKADGTVDFNAPAEVVRAKIHGVTPWPGCRVRWSKQGGEPEPLFIRRVKQRPDVAASKAPGHVQEGALIATAAGCVELVELQVPGGKPLPFKQFVQGHPVNPGDILTPWED